MPLKKLLSFLVLISPLFATQADEVRIYNWSDYLSDEVIEGFTKETGHTVTQILFDDESVRDEVIASGRSQGFDLVVIESTSLQIMAEQGFFQSLSSVTAEFSAHLDPAWVAACGEYGVPYAWGTTGILYRSSVSATPINSWSQLFNPPEEHRGRIVMYLDPLDAPGAALLSMDLDPFSDDKNELKRALELIKVQQPYLLANGYSLGYAEEHGESSQMSLGMGYAGDLEPVIEATGQNDWVYVVPKEGSMLWGECMSAPAGSNLISDATKAFLAYIHRPEVAALNAEDIWSATPNRAALPYTSEEYRQDKNLYPSKTALDNSVPYRRMAAQSLRWRNRIVNSVKGD